MNVILRPRPSTSHPTEVLWLRMAAKPKWYKTPTIVVPLAGIVIQGLIAFGSYRLLSRQQSDEDLNSRVDQRINNYRDTRLSNDIEEKTASLLQTHRDDLRQEIEKVRDSVGAASERLEGVKSTVAHLETSIRELGQRFNGIDDYIRGKWRGAAQLPPEQLANELVELNRIAGFAEAVGVSLEPTATDQIRMTMALVNSGSAGF
jgi:chromosome segregation ATPase